MDHHRTNTSQRSNPSTTKPMKPEEVLASATHAAALTIHEATEILDFPTVHYVGTAESKVRSSGVANNGFDDDKGDYIVNLHDHIAYRYDVVGHLGRGSFGQEQSVVEVQLLQHLNHADVDGTSNVIAMLDTFTFRNHLCLVFELLSISLYEYLKLEQFRGLPVPLLKKIATDVLHCLVFLHAQNVVHCDLKPENILVRKPKPMQVAVIDFGSSCFHHATFFTYIQSRFYRAPEVVLGLPYGMPIDMWSFACIMAELFTGYPVFPGENEGEQLACIMEVFDVPPKHMVDKCKRRKNFFNDVGEPTITINSRGRKRRPNSREFRALIKCQDLKFVDLLTKCFRWDPAMRCTPMEALDHEWLTGESKLAKPPVITPSTASSGGGQKGGRMVMRMYLFDPEKPTQAPTSTGAATAPPTLCRSDLASFGERGRAGVDTRDEVVVANRVGVRRQHTRPFHQRAVKREKVQVAIVAANDEQAGCGMPCQRPGRRGQSEGMDVVDVASGRIECQQADGTAPVVAFQRGCRHDYVFLLVVEERQRHMYQRIDLFLETAPSVHSIRV
ncbi:hypothetical protein AaE_006409 [Aphanomyces astaci]|uniref:dual-specificity kinase n=1 Tax=Aphanomyces astaci TaxID=112090 RepID=A0A6A5A5D8_APHAT|nr:hypothetical protein AaE_006409 [Aphanomyces astaci]